ncbi:hypothetical protein DENIT_11178 [Pseudomonas veronii]|nr:hypothetical protein DENIT_11178 [Pseudomonas veronii]
MLDVSFTGVSDTSKDAVAHLYRCSMTYVAKRIHAFHMLREGMFQKMLLR